MKFVFGLLFYWAMCGASIAQTVSGGPLPATQCVSTAVASGTPDAMFIPSLPCADTTTLLILTAIGPNQTTTPSIMVSGSSQRYPIVNANLKVLSIGQIPSAGTRLLLTFNGTQWVLLNIPGVVQATVPTPQAFGAKGDGIANDTLPVLACFASSEQGLPCTIEAGFTYIVDALTVPSNVYVGGSGTIKRLPNSTSTSFLACTSCGNVRLSGFTIDGNKSNETVAADDVHLTNYHDIHLHDGLRITNSIRNGLILDGSSDQSLHTTSDLIGIAVTSNAGTGITVMTTAWKLQIVDVVSSFNTAYGTYIGPTGSVNNIDSTLQYITVLGGDFSNNGSSGIVAQGFVTGYVGTQPIYGPGIEPVKGAKFIGITANDNVFYGIGFQARDSLLSDSIATRNASGTFGAGVLANGENIEVNNVKAFNNASFGIDAGCGIGIHIVGGDYSSNVIGVNVGCSQNSDVRGASIVGNTTAGITAFGAEAAGDGFGIPGATKSLTIQSNRIICPTTSAIGLNVKNGAQNLVVSDNRIDGCATNTTMAVYATSASVRGNTITPLLNGVDFGINGAVGTLTIPVWVDSVSLSGVNNFDSVKSIEQVSVGTGVFAVVVNSGGANYTKLSTATWSGCTVPPTGRPFVTPDGRLTGYLIDTFGSGCVNPTVLFSIGSGASVSVYQVPLDDGFQKELELVVGSGSSLTIGSSGNLTLAAPLSGAGASSFVKFHWGFRNTLYEESRVVH